jgi:type VI secretion system secreted protein Hcp
MKVLGSTLIGIALLLMVTVPSSTFAAESLFLRLDGIQGGTLDARHQGEIDLLSYSQSFTRPATGGQAGPPPTANCGAVIVTKLIDQSSPDLIAAVLLGTVIRTAVITFRNQGGRAIEYYKVTLSDVVIQSITQTDVSPTDPTTILEQVSMNANRFIFEYTPQLANGSSGAPITFGWDCFRNERA